MWSMRHQCGRKTSCAVLLCTACSAELGPAYDDSEEGTRARSSALTDGNGDPYRTWVLVTDRDGVGAAAVDDPGVCFSASGFVTFQRDSSDKFKSVTWDSSGVPTAGVVNARASLWTNWGGTRTFNSKPACANLDPVDSTANKTFKIVLTGRGKEDNKFYASSAQANQHPDGSAPDAPVILTTWSKLSDTLFASGPGVSVSSTKIVVVGVGTDGRVYAHYRAMPYASGGWTAVRAPALPSGWTANGSPTVAYTLAGVNKFTVLVRASRPAFSTRFFRATFSGTAWDSSPTWTEEAFLSTVAGDPALEFSTDVNSLTLFTFEGSRAGAYAVQATGMTAPFGPFRSIRSNELTDVFGGPAVHGQWGSVDGEGMHRIVVRKGSSLYFSETPPVGLYP